MKKPISLYSFLVSPIGLICLVSVVHCGHGSNSISQTFSSKFTQIIDKLNSLKRSTDTNNNNIQEPNPAASTLHIAESREPGYGHSNSYGGGGGGGGGYSSYGGGGGKGYGSGHGAITLDPVSIISLLALGAFLINNILQLLRANSMMTMASGRSLYASDINIPLDLSDIGIGAETAREIKEDTTTTSETGEPSFSNFFKNVGSLYYLAPKKRNICIKKVVCNYVSAQQRDGGDPSQGSLRSRIFDIMLTTITTLVAPEINEDTNKNGGGEQCLKFNKYCSDTVLRDAKLTAEQKVYGHVSSVISKFALSQFLSG